MKTKILVIFMFCVTNVVFCSTQDEKLVQKSLITEEMQENLRKAFTKIQELFGQIKEKVSPMQEKVETFLVGFSKDIEYIQTHFINAENRNGKIEELNDIKEELTKDLELIKQDNTQLNDRLLFMREYVLQILVNTWSIKDSN